MILCGMFPCTARPWTSECVDQGALRENDNEERETRKQQQDRRTWGLIIDKPSESTTSEDTHRCSGTGASTLFTSSCVDVGRVQTSTHNHDTQSLKPGIHTWMPDVMDDQTTVQNVV